MIRARALARRRRGAVLAETAVVYPAFLMTVLAGLSLGMGLYRYQEVAHLARESARWASLQDATMRTPAQILSNVVRPKAVCVNPSAVTITTTPSQTDMATVTISYAWTPEIYFGTITLHSTARARIAY
ncbi:TadE family protein [Paludisphaera rhizosphaerae]|nr:TadE family protein [Paludisphaera rhizosphaerae]